MDGITKLEAHLISGNGYRLVDRYGFEADIISLRPSYDNGKGLVMGTTWNKAIDVDKIGTNYFVLCHPLSRLTTEIEGIGVPIVELAKIAFPKVDDWNFREKYSDAYSTENQLYFQFRDGDFESEIWIPYGGGGNYDTFKVSNQQLLLDTMDKWHFDRRGFIERGIGKEINLK